MLHDPSASRVRADAAKEAALHVLRRFGYTEGDLDYLLYEGQGSAPGDGDPDLQNAVDVLGRLRERERTAARE